VPHKRSCPVDKLLAFRWKISLQIQTKKVVLEKGKR
jgi:hypothetical protein